MQFHDDGMTKSPRRIAVWHVAALAMFALAWGGNQFTPLLTMYRQSDGYSLTTVDLLLAAYIGGLAPALLGGHRLRSRLGVKHTLVLALISSMFGSLALAGESVFFLGLGRILTGFGLGLAMAVGTSWVVELASRSGVSRASGAKRAALSLTAGLGLGAGVAGALASWGPNPTVLPYLVHLCLAGIALFFLALFTTNDDVWRGTPGPSRPRDLHTLRSPRFRRLILPAGPWVFGVAAISYVVIPTSMTKELGGWILPYTTGLALITLTVGFFSQEIAKRLDTKDRPRALPLGMAVTTIGLALASITVELRSPLLGVVSAVVLGTSYGIVLLGGLLETQRSSLEGDLSTMTGLYYALAYLGFLFPASLTSLARWTGTPLALSALTAFALVTCGAISLSSRRLHRDQVVEDSHRGPLIPKS